MKEITINELCQMKNKEGLILQGCGGDLKEWVDGINELLTEADILKNGSSFSEVYAFQNEGLTNLLFGFKNVDIDMGKLAMWRISTYGQFGGTWLSDYIENNLGMEEQPEQKPDCQLIGQNGNIFNLMGIASRTLRANGMADKAKEMQSRITQEAQSYYEALNIIGDYVNITGPDEDEPELDM